MWLVSYVRVNVGITFGSVQFFMAHLYYSIQVYSCHSEVGDDFIMLWCGLTFKFITSQFGMLSGIFIFLLKYFKHIEFLSIYVEGLQSPNKESGEDEE